MKKTWRLRSLGVDVAEAMRAAPSLGAAAKTLGVDKSTVFRWVKTGKVPAPGGRQQRRSAMPSLKGWAAAVRAAYDLDATEAELVSLAEAALAMARDPTVRTADRLAAMARFAALVRQIDLEVPDGQVESGDVRAFPRRAS